MGAGLEEEREKRPEGKREAQEEDLWESSWARAWLGGVAGSDGHSQATAVPRVTRLQWPP